MKLPFLSLTLLVLQLAGRVTATRLSPASKALHASTPAGQECYGDEYTATPATSPDASHTLYEGHSDVMNAIEGTTKNQDGQGSTSHGAEQPTEKKESALMDVARLKSLESEGHPSVIDIKNLIELAQLAVPVFNGKPDKLKRFRHNNHISRTSLVTVHEVLALAQAEKVAKYIQNRRGPPLATGGGTPQQQKIEPVNVTQLSIKYSRTPLFISFPESEDVSK
ncbi:hypothetical protein FA10DRAFT_262772 [Acaromyces ingoldii]|uniref:Uncharacterized protein n=1 Tax=Acaromyces ingoldii TaxID=215250 RepID=A0A316YBQ3_9BASI|nr:hypothetical protein FA10DRAFT_262772 [Acaromyces ingoldii]PWN86976.1 hypothetical protein FA10DRAFT_262772 [Acaromyces ingoldii]